ncbi:MAG: hypothetical protein ACR2O2_14935 [Ruegeria sp.]
MKERALSKIQVLDRCRQSLRIETIRAKLISVFRKYVRLSGVRSGIVLKKIILVTFAGAALVACETQTQKAETALMREQLTAAGKSTEAADDLREQHIGENLAVTTAVVLTSPIWIPIAFLSVTY